MSEKNSKTKRRLLEYLESKGISKVEFMRETGIKRGFLDTDKLDSTVTDYYINLIIKVYNDLSLEWLITGKGEMIVNNNENFSNLDVLAITKYIIANEDEFLENKLFLNMMDVLFADRNIKEVKSQREALYDAFRKEMEMKLKASS